MKRGVFLLILNFITDKENSVNVKKRFLKKKSSLHCKEINRYSINVNGKNVIVLELTEKDLMREEVITLLKIYKGRVLISQNFLYIEGLEEYLFNPVIFYQKALLSSLVNQIKTINKDWKRICVKVEEFAPFKEFYELVRISKTVTIITKNNVFTERFIRDCYNEYGAIVNVTKEISKQVADVYLDFNDIDNKGKLTLDIKGKAFLLYPDASYFDNCSEYQKLSQYNIEHNIICAAFSNK